VDEQSNFGDTRFPMATTKSTRPTKHRAAVKSAVARRRTAPAKAGRVRDGIPRDRKAFVRMLRPMVRNLVAEAVEDHLDVLESIEALKDPTRVAHEDLVRDLGR
jgi:hypothetical protein